MQPSRLSRRRLLQAAGVAAVAPAVVSGTSARAEVPPVRPDIGVSAHPFALGQVRLTASRWLDNQNRTLNTASITRTSTTALTFTASANGATVNLIPFYNAHGHNYTVYWRT